MLDPIEPLAGPGRERRHVLRAGLAMAAAAAWPVAAREFVRPQDLPAAPGAQAAQSPLMALTQAGERIVAVGLRGHVVHSDDAGVSWRQASVPVSSDLLAVAFPTPLQGWAVGHGGVVLHSADGGRTWQRQLEGRQVRAIVQRHYEARQAAEPPLAELVKRERALAADGGTPSFLDVHFDSPTTGYVVGTFSRVLRTDDAGRTWTPWMDRIDNAQGLHVYAIRRGSAGLYLAGEQGMVWRLDEAAQRFVALPTPYKGTLFGLVAPARDELLVFGMRGSLFRSADRGRTWDRIATASAAGITGGTALPDGRIVLVTQAGGLELSRDHGQSFNSAKPGQPMPYFGVTALGAGRLGLVGAAGVRIETLANQA